MLQQIGVGRNFLSLSSGFAVAAIAVAAIAADTVGGRSMARLRR